MWRREKKPSTSLLGGVRSTAALQPLPLLYTSLCSPEQVSILSLGPGEAARRRPELEDPDRAGASPVVGLPTQLLGHAVDPGRQLAGQAVHLNAQRHQERRFENRPEPRDVESVEVVQHGRVDNVDVVDNRSS